MSSVLFSTSFDDVAAEWSDLLSQSVVNTPFQTLQWQRVWVRELGNGEPLCILSFVDNGKVLGMASLRAANGNVTFVGDEDVCDYNDFLVAAEKEGPFFNALLDYLDGQQWNTLKLYSLTEGSPTLVHLPDLAKSRGHRVDVHQQEVCPGKLLPGTWDDYLAGLTKKYRHELRRKLRRLGSAEGVKWYALTSPEDVKKGMDDFLSLLAMSRQDKRQFLTPEREGFFRSVGAELSEMGLLSLFFLEVQGVRVASALTFDYGSSRMLYNSGYNPEYGYYSVGLLLKALSLRSAIEEGKSYYDFLRGDEPYKYQLGGVDKPVYSMVITNS